MLDDETIWNYLNRYKEGGSKLLLKDSHKGYSDKLPTSEIVQLDDHLNENTYLRTQDIVAYVSKRLKVKELKSNTGRKRLNINGAINIEEMCPVVGYSDSINAQSTISLLKKIELRHPAAESIYTICDNARYYRLRKVKEYLETSKIKLVFLPPYSPNLNLIERLWMYFRKIVLYNKCYKTYEEFKRACKSFFRQSKKHKEGISSLLTENFQIIGSST